MNIRYTKFEEPKVIIDRVKQQKLSKRLQGILPILVRMQNILEKPPSEVLDAISLILDTDSYKSLNHDEQALLKKYLQEWNLEDFMK